MEPIKIDRNSVRLIAGGKYLELNKSYSQEQYQQFVDGAIFIFDLLSSSNGKKEKEIITVARQEVTEKI